MGVLYLLHLLTFAHAVPSYTPRYCQEAVNTIKQVSSCPRTEEDRDNAARKKDCEKYSQQQNCSKATDFRYHCVINEYETELLEVCAPTRFILGYCTEFNVRGGRIQDHYSAECSTFDQPCSIRYKSTDAYLYESCYDLVGNHQTSEIPYLANMTSTTIASNNETSRQGDSTDSILNWLLPVVGSLILIMIAVLAVVFIYRKKRQWKRQRDRERLHAAGQKVLEDLHSPDTEVSPLDPHNQIDDDYSFDEISEDAALSPSFTDLTIYNSGRTIISMYREDLGTDLKHQNKKNTKAYLDAFRKLDEYFVETNVFKRAKEVIERDDVAILIGPPGNGKTSAAIHLMLKPNPNFDGCTMRKIERLSELALIDTMENTLVLIDNIFDGYVYDKEVERWRDGLVFVKSSKQRNVRLLITAKNDVIETVSKYMGSKSSVFDPKHVIDVTDEQLSDSEKLKIFDKQIDFAKKERNIEEPVKNENFRKEIVGAEGPIGFPLCAHLYACAEQNRSMGSIFFSHPMTYLRNLVKSEVDKDQTPKTKTLLLVLYLYDSCPQYSSIGKIKLLDEKKCRLVLRKFPDQYKEFDTSGLANQAKKLFPTILMQTQPELFCFKHQTICNAVGNYFFGEHFKMARESFPIETFVHQDFSTVTKKQCSEICVRLIADVVENSNVSKVFSCIALKDPLFAEIFCSHLQKHDVPFLRHFFAASGTPSCQFKFPGTFWVSMNKCSHLATLLTEMIRKKSIDTDLHFYASLFGDCCASDESLLTKANTTTFENAENAKDTVRTCITCEGNNIFHIVSMISKSDVHCFDTLKKLHADFHDRQPEMYKSRNKKGETPLNLAAKVKSVSRILSILTFLEFDEMCSDTKDDDGHYPIHNTVLGLESRNYNALLELEMTVRVCIFIVYGASSDHQTQAISSINEERFKHLHSMLGCESKTQNKMASIIEKLVTEIRNENRNHVEGRTELPNSKNRIGDSLLDVIQSSVSLLMKANFEI